MINSPDSAEQIARLRALLKAQPLDAASVCARLQISQPTFSRLWKLAGPDVLAIGAARARRYALARNLGGFGSLLPVFEVLADGSSVPFGELRILQNDWYCFTPHGGAAQLMLGMPFWLQDLRPQGFLGRMVPRLHRDLALPLNILEWSDDDTLRFLVQRGEDVPGNIILGNEAYRRFLGMRQRTDGVAREAGHAPLVPEHERAEAYARLADLANLGEAPGSSAGGEQPKFSATVLKADGDIEPVLVKFSPDIASANGRRCGDLLICEHLALETLREAGIAASATQVLETGARIYLQVRRFDRVVPDRVAPDRAMGGAMGRAPLVSMAGIDGLLGALDKNWTHATLLLRDQNLLSNADWQTVCLLDVFGALIGNSDRHPGNLSLVWDKDGRFTLAPVYDMLPMMYQPTRQGEVVPREFDVRVLDRLDLGCLDQARGLAMMFWQKVEQDLRISADMRQIGRQHATIIRTNLG